MPVVELLGFLKFRGHLFALMDIICAGLTNALSKELVSFHILTR